MTNTIKFAIAGASGRMGRTLIESVLSTPGCALAGAFDLAGSPAIGRDAGDFMGQNTGVIVTDSIESALTGSDVLIDFTRPEGTIHHLEVCRKLGTKIVIGTTGFTPQQLTKLEEASKTISMVWSPNMAVGVNATFKLLEVAAKILSDGYDIEVIEAHHNKKVDAPSGTALRMGEVIAKELGISLSEKGVFAREGITGEREKGTIGFATIRGGDIVGDHTVLFAGTGERIEITHKSSSRSTYAQGSIRAAKFIMDKNNGLFDMQDVLGLKSLKF